MMMVSWRQTASIKCITLSMHFSEVRNYFDILNDAKMCDTLNIAILILLHNIFGVNCSLNSLSFIILCHMDGISRSDPLHLVENSINQMSHAPNRHIGEMVFDK